MRFVNAVKIIAKRWVAETEGIATVEAALVFPILMTLLLGTFDMGNAILANQKTIRSSQVVADLITRDSDVSEQEITEAIEAGELAFAPLTASTYGIDIVSVRFDDDLEPQIVWRRTQGMQESETVLQDVLPLAEADNGVVVVYVRYLFEPVFAGFVLDNMPMNEVAFARGRESPIVNLE